MCVIAGYIGNEPAAPILLEMLQQEEGLAAGFYTGIATVHEGRLYYEKVIGDTATLIHETKALQLPGTIGFAHGRPPGGGGREFGHPFISQNNDMAYIANGSTGQYANPIAEEAHGSALLSAGHKFKSTRTEQPIYPFPVLSDGSIVHGSDIKCHAIAAAFDQLEGEPDGLLNATIDIFQRYPSEIVGLCLHEKRPDEIVAARHNLPLEIGRGADGAIYLASTTIAFPAGINWTMRMPAASGAVFRRDGSIRISPFTADLIPLGKFPSSTTIQNRLGDLLRDRGPLSIEEIFEEIKTLWPTGVLGEKEIVVFEALAAWLDEGRVEFETRQIPGVLEGTTAPRIWVHWKKPAQTRVVKSTRVENIKVHVRDATENDIEAIARITGAAFGPMSMERIAEDYFGEPLSEAGWEANKSTEVAEEVRSGAYQFILAEQDGEAVGYASWSYDEKRDLATVGHNAVFPEYQGRGIGSALQREILRRFHEAGYTRWKVTTLAHDYPAQRIYEKMGFEEVGRSVVYLRREPTPN